MKSKNTRTMIILDELDAISTVDGRYVKSTAALKDFFSEGALIKYRLDFQVRYLKAITKFLGHKLTLRQVRVLNDLVKNFSKQDARSIKKIENKINHDTKSVEIYLIRKLKKAGFPEKIINHIHFGLTSADPDNISRTRALVDMEVSLLLPVREIIAKLYEIAQQTKDMKFLARTHGQPAVPTTFGKELNVFIERILAVVKPLFNGFSFSVKLGGAVGNLNAHRVAYPHLDWLTFADSFIKNELPYSGRLYRSKLTTQIDAYDSHAEYFAIWTRLNTVLMDLSRDMRTYISNMIVIQKLKPGEVGSSAMPQKVNPIDLENGDGNFGLANSQFFHYMQKLPISGLQRDLTDSTVVRNLGYTFALCFVGYKAILRGLNKISPNEARMREELWEHPEIITEAIQTILRREGVRDPYNKLKKFSRGNPITMEMIKKFISKLTVSEKVKKELDAITPENYIGYAAELAV